MITQNKTVQFSSFQFSSLAERSSQYVLSRKAPKVTTPFGEVYMGSALSYQVSIFLLRK